MWVHFLYRLLSLLFLYKHLKCNIHVVSTTPLSSYSFSLCLCAGHGEMVQRILDILLFLRALVLAMVDGLTQWLNLLTKPYREISTVLCNERYFIIHKIHQVRASPIFLLDKHLQIYPYTYTCTYRCITL